MSSDSPKHPLSPEEVRAALRALGADAAPGEREFAAALHRRLVAAGTPPALTWLGRLRGALAGSRPVLTGAVLGALVTATAFLLIGANRGGRDTGATVDRETPAAPVDRPVLRPSSPGAPTKAVRTLGDHRLTRDRLGEDIGAERPERARAKH